MKKNPENVSCWIVNLCSVASADAEERGITLMAHLFYSPSPVPSILTVALWPKKMDLDEDFGTWDVSADGMKRMSAFAAVLRLRSVTSVSDVIFL